MEEIAGFDIINVITPLITLVGGWFFGRRKQKNDFLGDLQASIDLLAEKNRILVEESIRLRSENAALRSEWMALIRECNRVLKELNPKERGVKS
jgi:hypothetical protein